MTVKQFVTTVLLTIFSLSLFATDYYTATTTLNVRSGAGTDYSILFSINAGDEIELISQDNDWYQIKYNGQPGYVSNKFLQFSRSANTTTNNDIEKSEETMNTYIVVGVIIGVVLLIIFLASSGKRNPQPQTNISSPTVTQQQSQPRVIVMKSIKNVGTAVFLAIMFPYFGVLYATVSGFFWLFFSYIGMWALIFYWGIKTLNDGAFLIGAILTIPHYLISLIWAGVAASNYNKKISSEL